MSFRFDVLEATKDLWGVGESVRVRYRIINDGEVSDAEIIVTDIDTLLDIARFVARNVISTHGDTVSIGSMPDHDWRLRFVVNP